MRGFIGKTGRLDHINRRTGTANGVMVLMVPNFVVKETTISDSIGGKVVV